MALAEAGDENYEFRGDRPSDGLIGDFAVWDPNSEILANQTDQDIADKYAGRLPLVENGGPHLHNKAYAAVVRSMTDDNDDVNKAFDVWVSGKYPRAKNVGDVIALETGKYIEPTKPEPQAWPPRGATLVSELEEGAE